RPSARRARVCETRLRCHGRNRISWPAGAARESLSTRQTASPKSVNSGPSPRATSSAGTGVSQRGGQESCVVAALEELVEGGDTLHLRDAEPGPGGRVEAEHGQGRVEAFAEGREGPGVFRVGGGPVAAASDGEVVGDLAGLDDGGHVAVGRDPGDGPRPDLLPEFSAVVLDTGGEVGDAVGHRQGDDLAEDREGPAVSFLRAAGAAGAAVMFEGGGWASGRHATLRNLTQRHSRSVTFGGSGM